MTKRNDILRPTWTGRGSRSFYVLETNGEALTVQRFNVARQRTYGEAFTTTYAEISAMWEHNQKRQGVASAPRYEGRWAERAQWTHNVWNHNPDPEGDNKV